MSYLEIEHICRSIGGVNEVPHQLNLFSKIAISVNIPAKLSWDLYYGAV